MNRGTFTPSHRWVDVHEEPRDDEPYDFTNDHHHYRKIPGGTEPASYEDCQLCKGGDFV